MHSVLVRRDRKKSDRKKTLLTLLSLRQLDQLQTLLISPMDRIVRVDMRSLADMQRKFDEARDQYDQAKKKNDLSQNK